ncbi:2'-5' RNA ligase family protein [Propionivibrio soli]|uniref:2'-5' RNA ligase family protein n=1 Tax=Propionivibrio soli TaxID=2976531 RepID=UPI0021E98F5D|nr:2'-5' RNA ligase family protein [Propionivibrio soli]
MNFDDSLCHAPEAEQDTPLTSASIHADFVDWRKGRRRYAVWGIDVDCAPLRAMTSRLRHVLGDCLLPGYERQPHITLRACGFPTPAPVFDDDYSPAHFACHIEALVQAQIPPFRVTVGRPATFPSAAYLSVQDEEGGIAQIRDALIGLEPAEPDFEFVPHITFGLYRRRIPVAQVMQRLAACPDVFARQLDVRQISLMTYEASVITGPLRSICEFNLAEGRVRLRRELRPFLTTIPCS